MFLKRLELAGFKSFAPHTTTDLNPGIVVVVGPNGSGKSNIADAVRWVLGEQSAKAVRARKPEEVIFAGSASRQPLGMAEASLVLDNADGSLPIEYSDVRVTRRLFRSGESEYLLNGARVRLKDITQLLLHAGMSPDSYTVIGQGSIDELILQRPEERRIAFESAADIRRHQIRLNETRSRLGTTETNLTRVQDVIAELAPHVKRLRNQADRAARADNYRAELHNLLLTWFRLRLRQATQERDAAERQLHDATAAADRAEAETLAAENALTQLDAALAALDEQLAVLRPRVTSYREQAAATERALAVTRERAAGRDERRATTEAEVERLTAQLERLEAEQAVHATDTDPEADDSDQHATLDQVRDRLNTAQSALEGAQRQREQVAVARDAAQQRTQQTDQQLNDLERELQAIDSAVAVEQARSRDRQERINALQTQLQELTAQAEALQDQQLAAETVLEAATERHALASEAERAATEALRSASQQADRLHGALQALGAPTPEEARELPDAWQKILSGLPVLGLAGELARRVRPIDLLLRAYLARTVVLADDAAAKEAHRRLASELENTEPAWAVLSLEGLLLTPGGETPLEAADARTSGLADWRKQLRQLQSELQTAEAARASAETTATATSSERTQAAEAERSAREALNTLAAERDQRRRSARIVESELHDTQADHQRSQTALEQQATQRDALNARVDALRKDATAARQALQQATAELQEHDQRVATHQEQLSQAQADLVALEAAQAQRQVERIAQQALRDRILAEITATRSTLASNRATLELLSSQTEESAQREQQLVEEIQTTLLALAPMEEELSTAEVKRSDLLASRRAEEARLVDLRARERMAREEREDRHVHAQRAADDLERLDAEIAETAELESDAEGGPAWAEQLRLGLPDEPEEPHQAVDLEAMRRRINVLQRELRAVGGVADSVVDEFRELSERHDFLSGQSDDLRAAMAELQQAAAELEAHMRERFSAVFEATQEAFQECFARLFGGGEARLVLTEPDNLLRTGVDIVARPPGKKLQGLLSLSGGERALTIVALLFGLLKVNPTPFCVLDEVDAALDEANVQRFANLLADFARDIQFVVVTHNRATMDRADALYGVSMDADGISRIFSIKPHAVASLA